VLFSRSGSQDLLLLHNIRIESGYIKINCEPTALKMLLDSAFVLIALSLVQLLVASRSEIKSLPGWQGSRLFRLF
jgi:hypothetical protein